MHQDTDQSHAQQPLKPTGIRQIVATLQKAVGDPEPYLNGGCVKFAAAVALVCDNYKMGTPKIRCLFRDEHDMHQNDEVVGTCLSHCTILEHDWSDDYDARNLTGAALKGKSG